MKKIPLLLIVFLFYALYGYAQDLTDTAKGSGKAHSYSIKLGIGNAFPVTGDAASGTSTTHYSNKLETLAFNMKRSSHFSGLNGSIGGEYMFSRYLGIACNVNILLSSSKYSNAYINDHGFFDSLSNAWKTVSSTETSKAETNVLLMPCLLLQNNGSHLNFYSKVGLVLPIVNKISESYDDIVKIGIFNSNYEYKTHFGIGYTGAIGINYKINQRLHVWGEVNVISFAPFLKDRTITKFTVNGKDSLSEFLPQERNTKYAFSGSSLMNAFPRNYERPTSSLSSSNAGIQVGLALRLGSNTVLEQEAKMHGKQRVYFKVGMGYALQNQSSSSGQFSQSGTQTLDFNYSKNAPTISFKYKPFSFLSGFSCTAGAGRMFTKHFGLELDAVIGMSAEKYSYTAYIQNQPTGTGTYDSYSAFSYAQAKTPVLLIPSLVFRSGGERLDVYSRLGVVMPLKSKVTEETGEIQSPTQAYTIMYEYRTRFTLGYNCAAGVSYKISNHMQIWGEASLISLSPFLKEQKINSYTINGKDIAQNFSEDQLVTEYKFSGSTVWGPKGPMSQNQIATFSLPFSNIGLNIGVSYHL